MNNIVHGLYHTVLTGIAVYIPVLLMGGASWQAITIGGALAWVANWAKLQLA